MYYSLDYEMLLIMAFVLFGMSALFEYLDRFEYDLNGAVRKGLFLLAIVYLLMGIWYFVSHSWMGLAGVEYALCCLWENKFQLLVIGTFYVAGYVIAVTHSATFVVSLTCKKYRPLLNYLYNTNRTMSAAQVDDIMTEVLTLNTDTFALLYTIDSMITACENDSILMHVFFRNNQLCVCVQNKKFEGIEAVSKSREYADIKYARYICNQVKCLLKESEMFRYIQFGM